MGWEAQRPCSPTVVLLRLVDKGGNHSSGTEPSLQHVRWLPWATAAGMPGFYRPERSILPVQTRAWKVWPAEPRVRRLLLELGSGRGHHGARGGGGLALALPPSPLLPPFLGPPFHTQRGGPQEWARGIADKPYSPRPPVSSRRFQVQQAECPAWPPHSPQSRVRLASCCLTPSASSGGLTRSKIASCFYQSQWEGPNPAGT